MSTRKSADTHFLFLIEEDTVTWHKRVVYMWFTVEGNGLKQPIDFISVTHRNFLAKREEILIRSQVTNSHMVLQEIQEKKIALLSFPLRLKSCRIADDRMTRNNI